jgi:hypothetical protein
MGGRPKTNRQKGLLLVKSARELTMQRGADHRHAMTLWIRDDAFPTVVARLSSVTDHPLRQPDTDEPRR